MEKEISQWITKILYFHNWRNIDLEVISSQGIQEVLLYKSMYRRAGQALFNTYVEV